MYAKFVVILQHQTNHKFNDYENYLHFATWAYAIYPDGFL